ncbi:uncharacterized protein TRUGW13939_05961 [Talaromyces rugulosus]|uniref:cyclin-dependent kinase n=1 Tax=Talaromyces rugulosus TaxID=121627 RepID=A0A7H8R1T1_TALRU|nr:uncharacterized protein TRUGW13939_05961 [Talaromyces rugulosus]QKX58833.1 hypothetical protein TRUGW13939_05961 [Talaromyces rugulosus]
MTLERNIKYLGRSKAIYSLSEPLYPRYASGITQHVWKSHRLGSDPVVVKFRRLDTPQSRSDFQNEITQLRKLEDCRYIRGILDAIEDPADKAIDHGMILEWFPETLWEARENGRLSSFGLVGIRKIMKNVLEGIQELHSREFIHLDIKAQNILSNGLSAKLSDLGSIWPASPSSRGTAQPMPYRSPGILFGREWSKEVDIWGWGMVYVHMVQACIRPDIWGLYDRLHEESTLEATTAYEERVRQDIFHDFRLYSIRLYEECEDRWPGLDPDRKDVTIRSILEYLQFPENEICFLQEVLNPDPTARPTAKAILDSGWLDNLSEDH